MISPIDVGVYIVVFLISMVTAATFFAASRKFVKGEFKDFINWVLAASLAFMLGSMLSIFNVMLSETAYGPMLIIVAGFAYVLMGACFIRAATLLHGLSKVFGFAHMEEELEHVFGKMHKAGQGTKKAAAARKK